MDVMDALVRARQLLMVPTPLHGDCGRLCAMACCQPDADGKGGMLLFPEEEKFYRPLPQGFSISEDPDGLGRLLSCLGVCARENRPLACRFFPLFPYVRERANGLSLSVQMDRRAGAMCPLVEARVSGVSQAFTRAVKEAARVLATVPAHRAFLIRLTHFMDETYVFNGGIVCSGSV